MDEFHKELKLQKEACYLTIEEAGAKLRNIRINCQHPSSQPVNYNFGNGRIIPNTHVCDICGDVIKPD